MPKTKRSSGTKKQSKADLIREEAKKLGKTIRPRDIVAALSEKGIKVGYTQIAKALAAGGFKPKQAGSKPAPSASVKSVGAEHVNKAERIREVAKKLGKKVRPKDVISELKSEGIEVSSAQVSTTLRAAGYRRKHRQRKITPATHMSNGNSLNLDALIAAKEFINKAGGIQSAEAAIHAMKKLV